LKNTTRNITVFVDRAIAHLNIEEHVEAGIFEGIAAEIDKCGKLAEEELRKLCIDEAQQPVTYNHYYTDNVQKSRLDALKKTIEKAVGKASSAQDQPPPVFGSNSTTTNASVFNGNSPFNMSADALIALLSKSVTVDMDEQACTEALAGLNAYYKVSDLALLPFRSPLTQCNLGGPQDLHRQRLQAGDRAASPPSPARHLLARPCCRLHGRAAVPPCRRAARCGREEEAASGASGESEGWVKRLAQLSGASPRRDCAAI